MYTEIKIFKNISLCYTNTIKTAEQYFSDKQGSDKMATINDVAKLAGVSRGTVSNVINNVKVRKESYIAVKKAIEELGYVPNQYARALKTNKTNTIALILPTIWNPFFSELTYHVEKEAGKRGYKLLLCNSNDDYKVELTYIAMAKENKVDGIISITYSDIEPYLSSKIPIVTLERNYGDGTPFITCENINGGKMAAEELVKAGCKRILCIGRSSAKNTGVKDRAVGFKQYCEENNIEHEVFYSNNPDEIKQDFSFWIKDYITENFAQEKKFDGIFTVTDRYAQRIIDNLAEFNLSVPEDVQIIGYDGTKSYKNEITKITTIRQPIEKLAEEAVKSLDTLINGGTAPKQTILPVSFMQGETTVHK